MGDYMSRDNYLKALENSILKAGYNEYYVAKCLRYANRLIDNGLPVIFDIKHLALLVGMSASDMAKVLFAEKRFYKAGENGNAPLESRQAIQRGAASRNIMMESIVIIDFAEKQ